MGVYFFDQYSLLHLASGIIAYFFGINIYVWFIIHLLFELIENTKMGVHFIDTYLFFWPGGKLRSDETINSIGDQFFAILGWYLAYFNDIIGKKYIWDPYVKS